jgi:hypothetical protein
MLGLGLSIPQIAVRGTRFSPGSLFAAGEQGAWYDPSDFSTLFQDSAGTTPVTAVEQPVGLMLDKSKGLVLGPELVTNGDFSNGTTGWTPSNATLAVVSGELEVTNSAALAGIATSDSFSTVAGRFYVLTYTARRGTSSSIDLQARTSAGAALQSVTLTNTTNTNGKLIFAATTSASIIRVVINQAVAGRTGFIDNISVRELPGNHAFQSTPTSRPTLSARVNLLTKTEQFNDVAWTPGQTTVTANAVTAPNGTLTADKLVETATTNNFSISQGSSGIFWPLIGTYTFSFYAKAAERNFAVISFASGDTPRKWVNGIVDLSNGDSKILTTLNSPTYSGFAAQAVGNGWYKISITAVNTTTGGAAVGFLAQINISDSYSPTTDAVGRPSYAGDITKGIYLWGADLRVANDGVGLPAYQRVDTATSYDTAGFPLYLRFDGSDDSFLTNSVNFTGTDKMTVWAGVRKLSDATVGIFVELSADTNINNGSWFLACFNATSRDYFSNARGTSTLTSPGFFTPAPAPDTSVLAVTVNLGTDLITLQRNTVAGTNSIGSLGGGNFGNYPLYIGRRNNATLPYNGRLYSLIIRGAQSTATQIAQTESYVNSKTRAF